MGIETETLMLCCACGAPLVTLGIAISAFVLENRSVSHEVQVGSDPDPDGWVDSDPTSN